MKALKRMARYLVGRARYVVKCERQHNLGVIEVQVDIDHAGCLNMRKSTSGGVLKSGNSVINSWSHAQAVIALSSGEADYYGIVKGASYSRGIRSLAPD